MPRHKFWSSEDAKKITREYFQSKATLVPYTISWVRNEILTRHGLRFSKATIGLHLRATKKPAWMTSECYRAKPSWASPKYCQPEAIQLLEKVGLENGNRPLAVLFSRQTMPRHKFWSSEDAKKITREYFQSKATLVPYTISWVRNEILTRHGLRFSKATIGLHLRATKKPAWMTAMNDSHSPEDDTARSPSPTRTITLDSDGEEQDDFSMDEEPGTAGEKLEGGKKIFHRRTFWMTREGIGMLRKYVLHGGRKAHYSLQDLSEEIATKYGLEYSRTSLFRQVTVFKQHMNEILAASGRSHFPRVPKVVTNDVFMETMNRLKDMVDAVWREVKDL
uniref:HTH_Tnp_Tc3_2 domain-containing protein n=1 Tax=Steinernema glaseri TaxID=37863 RepID=A0A1I7ZMM2_9BILA